MAVAMGYPKEKRVGQTYYKVHVGRVAQAASLLEYHANEIHRLEEDRERRKKRNLGFTLGQQSELRHHQMTLHDMAVALDLVGLYETVRRVCRQANGLVLPTMADLLVMKAGFTNG